MTRLIDVESGVREQLVSGLLQSYSRTVIQS
jgi:hypothetical protein